MRLGTAVHDYAGKAQFGHAAVRTARETAKEIMQQAMSDEDMDTLAFLYEEEEQDDVFLSLLESQRDEEVNQGSEPLEDASRRLTRQLVSANTQFVVQLIIGEAHQHLVKLRMVAMSGDEEAISEANAIIRRLEKLIRRGNRKVTDLGYEERLQRDQAKAEKEERIHRAKEIERELKRRYLERKKREERYLEDRDDDDDSDVGVIKGKPVNPNTRLDAAAEAKIAAQAKAMAAAEASAGQSVGSGGISSGTGGSNSAASAGSSGDDFASAAGAEDANAGSIDIAV